MQGSRGDATWKGLHARGMRIAWSDLHFTNGWSYNSADLNVGVGW